MNKLSSKAAGGMEKRRFETLMLLIGASLSQHELVGRLVLLRMLSHVSLVFLALYILFRENAKSNIVFISITAEHIFHSLQNLQDPTSKITSETNFSEALNKIASSQGFIISDNQGSGNCMFYALSEQLAAMKGIHIPHEALRRRIVHYLEMNPRLVSCC